MITEKQVETKQCSKCQEVKPLSEFHKRSKSKDGRQTYCLECQNRYYRKYRKDGRDVTPVGRAKKTLRKARYSRRQAEVKLGHAIKDTLQPYDIAMIQGADECIYCSKELAAGGVTVDHCKPFLAGGTNEYSNLLPCCSRCNTSKGTKPVYTYLTETCGYSESDLAFKQVVFRLSQRRGITYDEMLSELKQDAERVKEVSEEAANEVIKQ